MTKRLAIIDGKSVFYRGYYAMPNLSLADGTPTGGVYGFASLAIELIKKLEPDYVAVAWDKPKTNIRKRRTIYPEYKAGRKPAPPDFYAQIPILHELLEAFGWPLYELDDYEADDIMGTFTRQAEKRGIETCLLTSDLDALQLVGPLTKVYALKNGLANIQEFDVESFEKKYGIKTEQFLDLKALKGDSSDNLPGVPGIGEKTGIELLQKYDTLDNIYKHLVEIRPTVAKKLESGKQLAYLSKEVGSIWTDAPVELDWEVADVNDTNLEKVGAILKKLEFSSLIKRMPKHMQQIEQPSLYFREADEVNIKEVAWPKKLLVDGPVAVTIQEGELWLSINNQTVMREVLSTVSSSVWRTLELAEVICYDVKQFYHQLDEESVVLKLSSAYDVHQAAFLIEPLRRDRSLAALAGNDTSTSQAHIAALWQIYTWQKEALKNLTRIKEVAETLDFPLSYNLFLMEKEGVKIDKNLLFNMSQEFSKEYARLEQKMFSIVGYEFNIGSPAQLAEVLFTKLQLPTNGIKKGKTGYSTAQGELNKLRGQHPIIELIEKTRELAKLKSTYVDALPKLADKNNRVHTTFSQDVAATGRLSSSNPNLQNIPIRTPLGMRIRQAFIAEQGNLLVSADYSQFELRLAAVLAKDKELIEDFNSDVDIHTKTAAELYEIDIKDVTKAQRGSAKTINFSVLYGVSPHGLAASTGMSFAQAREFIDKYFALRVPIRRYLDGVLEQARTKGYVETYFGRRRPTPDVHSSNFVVRQAAERAAMNMPIQGTEADLMKRAMLEIDDKIDGLGKQILQIHDSILVECPAKNADKVAKILKKTMESIAPELSINLKVDVKMGSNWGEL